MVKPFSHGADQEKIPESAPDRFLHRVHRIRIILFPGQHDGFRVGNRSFVGIKIPDNQIRFPAELPLMIQSAVAVDKPVILPQAVPDPLIAADPCSADNDASCHRLSLPFAVSARKNDFLVINCIPFLSFRSGEQGNAVRSKSQELQYGKALRVC